jgi:hypothetical protein
MIRDPLGSSARPASRTWLTPRNLLIAGAAVNCLAILLAMREADSPAPLRVGLILTGLVLAMVAVNHRLRNFGEGVEERVVTAVYLAAGSFVVLLAYLASAEAWDTFRMVLGAFVCVGLGGALLVLLPTVVRRGVILALVLFHFGGILTAVFSVAPPSGVANWTAGALWTYVYRPYLQFMYLNNAYHFYSPEPGPAYQLWFRVSYDPARNVPPRWVQYPRRQDYPSLLLYQRSLAMTDGTSLGRLGYPADFFGVDGRYFRRYERAWLKDPKIPYALNMQQDTRHLAWPDVSQYMEPGDLQKKYIASYARHVAHDPKFRSPDDPDAAVVRVKMYRVRHNFLTPNDMHKGTPPDDPATLSPVYLGEFDAEGNLMDSDDPLLYWVVPIQREQDAHGQYVFKDYVAVHAKDTRSVLDPNNDFIPGDQP